MPRDPTLSDRRVDRCLAERIVPALLRAVPLAVTAWEAPGGPVPFAEAVVVEAVTLAEDRSGDVVLRPSQVLTLRATRG